MEQTKKIILRTGRLFSLAQKAYTSYKNKGWKKTITQIQFFIYQRMIHISLSYAPIAKFLSYFCRSDSFLMEQEASNFPHFAAPIDDYCLSLPLKYPTELSQSSLTIAVIFHVYYIDLVDEISNYLKNIPFTFDLFISTDSLEKKSALETYYAHWNKGQVTIEVADNRGRDIAPKLITFASVYSNYEFFLHIHTKKSLHFSAGENWRTYLFDTLLGSEQIVANIFEAFQCDEQLGIVAPEHFTPVRSFIGWGYNFKIAQQLASKFGLSLTLNNRLDFPSGSMFWARSAAIAPLLKNQFKFEDFPHEEDQTDGTLAHVIERFYFFSCELAGYRWIKILQEPLAKTSPRVVHVHNQNELRHFIKNHQYTLLNIPVSLSNVEQLIYEKSDNKTLSLLQFKDELKKLTEGKQSLIDFDEAFYLAANKDIAQAVANGTISSGYAHFCLNGKKENRLWSNNRVKKDFLVTPNYPSGQYAPFNVLVPIADAESITHLPPSNKPFLLILFSQLQSNLFFGGYSAFFHDFAPVFSQFDKIILSVESDEFEPHLAKKYASHIEVISAHKLQELKTRPDLIICFNYYLFHKGLKLLNDANKVIYYCQDFEACEFPLGENYIEVEKSIVHARNIVISTQILKNFFISRKLITDHNTYITSPQIEPWDVLPEKRKRLFFYFRPEYHTQRNLPVLITRVVKEFCTKHQGYTIYMIGTVDTCYSYELNGTPIYVLSKLAKQAYVDLITSCDLVVSLIYSPHPGIIAFQAAASGIPAITNTFDNRDKRLLGNISKNLIPYDPLRDNLLELIEYALTLPKGSKSFNESFYSGDQKGSLMDFIHGILERNTKELVH